MARRSVAKLTTSSIRKGEVAQKNLPESEIPPQPPVETDFVKVEKNLASLGFFTPSSKRIKDQKGKTISFTRTVDSKRVEVKATIAPAALFGLPITADQDKYLALQKLLNEQQQRTGRVENPVSFTSAELLRLLSKSRDSGKNYKDIKAWLRVMTSTTIISEGTVYLAGRKRWVQDTFHVFDRTVAMGGELEDGTVADRHYVWLSDWQLENINNHYQLPVDFENYRRLRSHIAKALVPLLQVWLYASEHQGLFRKRHSELCRFLNIQEYKSPAHIKRHLGGALDELRSHEYLSDWKLERTEDRRDYIVVFYHGNKFHRDRQLRLVKGAGQRRGEESGPLDGPEGLKTISQEGRKRNLIQEIQSRGIAATAAKKAVQRAQSDQDVIAQLEWGDFVIARNPDKIENPAGFYLSLIKENVTPPVTFETSPRRGEREEREENAATARVDELRLKIAYEAYQQAEVSRHVAELAPATYQARVDAKKVELGNEHRKLFDSVGEENFTNLARCALAKDLIRELPLLSFSAFRDQQKSKTS